MAQVIQLKDGSLHTVLGEQDILSLVEQVQARVLERTGVRLEPEVKIIRD